MSSDGDMRVIDARGHRCPTPTLRLRRAIAAAARGSQVTLICDDPMARIDVPHFAMDAGLDLIETSERDGVLSFVVAVP